MIKIQIEIDDRAVTQMLQRLIDAGQNPRPALKEVGEDLVESTKRRFETQTAPDGSGWERNAPSTIKKKGRDQPLTGKTGKLMDQINYNLLSDYELEVGSPMQYAAIHQFGGQINKAAQSRLVRHRTTAKGALLKNKKGQVVFAKDKHKRAVGRWFEQGAHTIDIPPRPFLGVSADDEQSILNTFINYLRDQI